jgi:hypothetical protein
LLQRFFGRLARSNDEIVAEQLAQALWRPGPTPSRRLRCGTAWCSGRHRLGDDRTPRRRPKRLEAELNDGTGSVALV